jgi:glycosyltransferase involved in cell wall biosynthesis
MVALLFTFLYCLASNRQISAITSRLFDSHPGASFLILIVIPCFNEARRLVPEQIIAFLDQDGDTELLFVDDASIDQTSQILHALQDRVPDRLHVLSLSRNQGKGNAVRQGILHGLQGTYHLLGYWDADLATPLPTISTFARQMEANPHLQMICGSRVQRLGASIQRHWYRHYPGRFIATWISLLLSLPVYDTQCGAKLFTSRLAEDLFAAPFLSRWLFDVELFARIIGLVGREEAVRQIQEYPLERWTDVGESKVSLSYLPKIPFELWRISRHYRHQLENS